MMPRILLLALAASVPAICLAADDKKTDEYGTVVGIDLGTTYSW